MINAVTFNLGCGGPHSQARTAAAFEWAVQARSQYDLVFAQEIPGDEWLELWRDTHIVHAFNTPKYRVRSAILANKVLASCDASFPTSDYHDSYVAACNLQLDSIGTVVCMSVHASPSIVAKSWLEPWRAARLPLPQERASVGLWDADMLLSTVLDVATRIPVLIAGDWNEARAWDANHPHNSGEAFFQRVEVGGLIDCTYSEWQTERATCLPTHGESLQVDHVFATNNVADLISGFEVGAPPAPEFDHLPISFAIDSPIAVQSGAA